MATYFLQNDTIYTTNNGFDKATVPFIPLREFLVDVWNGFAVIDPKNCQKKFEAHLMDMMNKEIYMLPHNLRVVACDVVQKMIENLKADQKKALDGKGKHYVFENSPEHAELKRNEITDQQLKSIVKIMELNKKYKIGDHNVEVQIVEPAKPKSQEEYYNATLISGIVCNKCGVELPQMLMSEHLDINNPKNKICGCIKEPEAVSRPKEEEPPKEKPKPKEVREREQTRMANRALAEKKKAKAEYERQCEIANANRIARMKREAERKKQQKKK